MTQQRVSTLNALYKRIGGPRKAFFDKLIKYLGTGERFQYNTLTGALNGHWPPRKGPLIEKAIERLAIELGLELGSLAEDSLATAQVGSSGRAVPDHLRGAWFLVQFRGKRAARREPYPGRDFRVAILVYGASDAMHRPFQVIGKSTVWHGHVTLHPQDRVLYYFAEETRTEPGRTNIDEWLHMTIHDTFGGGVIADHHGILVGISRGENDGPQFPIYASRVLLCRIETEPERGLSAPLNNDIIKRLRKYCDYLPDNLEIGSTSEDNDALLGERQRAIQRFKERDSEQNNYGDRIFVAS